MRPLKGKENFYLLPHLSRKRKRYTSSFFYTEKINLGMNNFILSTKFNHTMEFSCRSLKRKLGCQNLTTSSLTWLRGGCGSPRGRGGSARHLRRSISYTYDYKQAGNPNARGGYNLILCARGGGEGLKLQARIHANEGDEWRGTRWHQKATEHQTDKLK